jgi:hypothetical protein
MIPKHTPGPWEVEGTYIVADLTLAVAEVNGPNRADLREQKQANRRLVAAAPDLLAALIRCAGYLEDMPYPEGRDALKQAEEAISKAL